MNLSIGGAWLRCCATAATTACLGAMLLARLVCVSFSHQCDGQIISMVDIVDNFDGDVLKLAAAAAGDDDGWDDDDGGGDDDGDGDGD